jgi:uncharacterized damage-inducible protein DinB
MRELARAVIEETRFRLLEGFPAQLRAALDALSEDELWQRPHEGANAVANLVIHLAGSTRLFLGRGVGGSDYERDRPAEFSFRGPLPRAELLALIDDVVDEARRVLDALEPDSLLESSDRVPGGPLSRLALLLRVSHHWAVHTGQVVYAAKAARAGAIDELWTKAMKGR